MNNEKGRTFMITEVSLIHGVSMYENQLLYKHNHQVKQNS